MIVKKFPRDDKERITSVLRDFFRDELSHEIGMFEVENLIDLMVKEIGPFIYNTALADARKVIEDKRLALEDELYTLEKPVNRK